MNDSIFMCATSICVCLVVCSVIRIVAPTGNTSRILSVVISVFVLLCMFSPLKSLVESFRFESDRSFSEDIELKQAEGYDEQVILQTASYINEYVNNILVNEGVENSEIKTILAVNENRGIYIRELNIYLSKGYSEKSAEIKELIKSSLGVEPLIKEAENDKEN